MSIEFTTLARAFEAGNWSYLFHIHATTICVLDKKTSAIFAPTGFQVALNTFTKKCVWHDIGNNESTCLDELERYC
jgi:hypothetical protein